MDLLKTIDVISMGRVAVDLYAQQLNTPLNKVESFQKYLGGSPGNISVGCSRLGLKSALISKVGQDAMGDFLTEKLIEENVDISMLSSSDKHLTALAFLGISPPSTFPLLFYRNDCADMQLTIDDINLKKITAAKVLQISGTGISTESMREVTLFAIEQAHKAQTKVVFDLDYRPVLWGLCQSSDSQNRYVENQQVSLHYKKFLSLSDLIVGTDQELMIAGGCNDVEQAIKNIKKYSKANIVYKKGLEGSEVHVANSKRIIHADTFPVDVLNTLGAGDAFMSGLLLGLINNEPWQQMLSYGNAAGAIVSTRHGCSPAMPSKDELLHFIKQYPKRGAEVLTDLTAQNTTKHQSPLIKAPACFDSGLSQIVNRNDDYKTGMNFSVLKLNQGQNFTIDDSLETAALLMFGKVKFIYGGKEQQVFRRSYFDEAPFVLHTPQTISINIEAQTDCELLIMQTANDLQFEAMLFDESNMLENEHRGEGLLDDVSYRMVRTVFDKRNRPESNLVVGEIITFQGRWSSCPPHYHKQPEIYHYRFSEPQGFAFAEDGEQALKVHHNETLVIQNQKTHAHVSAPGYALYTLWFIRHLEGAPYIAPDFVKEHDWCRQDGANLRAWRTKGTPNK